MTRSTDDQFDASGGPDCPACGQPQSAAAQQCDQCGALLSEVAYETTAGLMTVPDMRYPDLYVWLVFISALDVLLTMLVVFVWRGSEVNPVAAAVIDTMGFGWAIVFKFATIVLVILICEAIGRRDDKTARMLGGVAIALNALAVSYTFALLIVAGPAELIPLGTPGPPTH